MTTADQAQAAAQPTEFSFVGVVVTMLKQAFSLRFWIAAMYIAAIINLITIASVLIGGGTATISALGVASIAGAATHGAIKHFGSIFKQLSQG